MSAAIVLLALTIAAPCLAQPSIEPTPGPGEVINASELPEKLFLTYSGGRAVWGKNALVAWKTLKPGTETSLATLPGERILFVLSGSVTMLVDDAKIDLREKDLVYHRKGTRTALIEDDNTTEILEFHWPVNRNILGGARGHIPKGYTPPPETSSATVPPGRVFNLDYLQYCDPGDGTMVRFFQGNRGQACFIRIEPNVSLSPRSIPEEQLLVLIRGAVDITIGDETKRMEAGDITYLPPDMQHGIRAGAKGCEFIAVVSPARDVYTQALKERIASFHSLFTPLVQPELLVDGRFGDPLLGFAEGPNWLNGGFYFSDQQYGGMYTVDRDGSLEMINDEITPCGAAVLQNGNLAVCDIKNKSIVEMTPDGAVIGTLADTCDGKAFQGIPNDVICDAGDGLYFTVMSFSGNREGNVVMYRDPRGKVVRVTAPGDFGVPNGCALSPDGSVLYLNDDTSGYVWVFDVEKDGALSGKRSFAKLILDESQLGKERYKSFSDGMTVDAEGNLFVCASGFIQIFDPTGGYLGGFVFPKPTFHCAFGGDDLSTLYVNCMNQVYTLKTKTRGVRR